MPYFHTTVLKYYHTTAHLDAFDFSARREERLREIFQREGDTLPLLKYYRAAALKYNRTQMLRPPGYC